MTKVERQVNIELLRILCMFFIMMFHFNLNIILRNDDTSQNLNITALLVNSLVIVAVNTFILISGYFSIKIKVNSFVGLLIQTEFYAIIAISVYLIFGYATEGELFVNSVKEGLRPYHPTSLWIQNSVIGGLVPYHPNGLWFIPCYVLLLFISPVLNWICASKRVHRIMLYIFASVGVILFVIIGYDGYSILNFILLYLIGRWIALYPGFFYKQKNKQIFCAFFVSVVITFTLAIIWWKLGHHVGDKRMFAYSSPWVIFSSICLFLLFKNMHIKWRWVNFVSPSVLSVYLLHENSLISGKVYGRPLLYILSIMPNDLCSYLGMVLYGVLLFFIIVLFDKITRIWLQSHITKALSKLELWQIIDANLKRMNNKII